MPIDASCDVAIVGAGSAGCVLACRLSEDPDCRVILIEAGPDYAADQLPADLADGRHGTSTSTHDWGLRGIGVTGSAVLSLPRGRVTGGSSAVNACFAMRGHPDDYDNWRLPGWAFEDVLPTFRRLERDLDFGEADYHGTDGPITIRRYLGPEKSAVAVAVEDAISELGIPAIPDHNAPGAVGVSALPVNCVDGTRISTALAYLETARGRENLTIRPDCLVREVVVERGRVTGLWTDTGEFISATEVFVCAGTYHSPALLMRSGIGPAADVLALGRPVVADLAGVGENLSDHPAVSIQLPCRQPRGDPAIFQMAATTHSTRADRAGAPDLQLMVCGPFLVGESYECSLAAALLRPSSRGRVTIRDLDANTGPDIDLGYLRELEDLDRLAECLRIADEATQTESLLRETRGFRIDPPRDVVADGAARTAWIRGSVWSYHHPVGTCAMGTNPDDGAVVDPAGHVFGVDGLSVVDASIMPVVPSANTNIPTIMMAEHIAAMRTA